ncbi:MAG: hypothetical protein ABIJ15_09385 [bacterium]
MEKALRKALLILISATPVFYGSLLTASEFGIGFTESEYTAYYDAGESSLDWDFSSGYLYLPYGSEENILQGNYPGPPNMENPKQDVSPQPNTNKPQNGYTFIVQYDCFISGVARFASSGGGNQDVRFWTDDVEECSSGMGQSGYWGPYTACVSDAYWAAIPVDFLTENYPLTNNNTYWIVNVHDGDDEHLIGQITNPVSATSFITLYSYWYLKNDTLSPLTSREGEGGVDLKGIADLGLSRFTTPGSLTTKTIDLGKGHDEVTKVDVENFEVSFQTTNARSSFDKIEKTGAMAYNLRYTTISALGRTPVCSADFEISESSNNVNFSEFKTDFADVHLRYIKLKMALTTQHRGVTPLLDDVKITYNAYPEKISTGSINVSPSSISSRDEILVTSSKPQFVCPASFDLDGDEITYNFVLAKNNTFSTPVFSKSVTSASSTTPVAVDCTAALQDKTTYYLKIDISDEQGASVLFDSEFTFKTNLTQFLCTDSSILNGERVLAAEVQSGISFSFPLELDFSTGSAGQAIEFLDSTGNSVPYNISSPAGSELTVVPSAGAILPCERYSIEISTALMDLMFGGFLEESFSINFLTLNDNSVQYTSELAGAKMVLPAGSVAADYFLEVSTIRVAGDAQLEAAADSVIGSAFIIPVSTEVFLFDITDANGADITSINGASLTLPFYQDSVDVEGISVSLKNKLKIFMLNETTGKWVLVPGTQNMSASAGSMMLSGGSVIAGPGSGGKFALLAYPENTATSVQLRNIPNPFYLGQITEITSGLFTLGVRNVKIGIFTLIGHKIYERSYTSSELGDIKWDGKNKDGAYVASGIYILKAEINYTSGDSETKTRKIGFIRSWD